jgi:outer membrane immunogenic protein
LKKIVLASVAALAFATPSFAAEFSGARVGATVGFVDEDFAGTEAFTYGVNAGYDFDLGKTVVGATVEWQDSDEETLSRDLAITGRFGVKAGKKVLVYGLAGYTNLGVDTAGDNVHLDGVRAGAGVEVAFTPQVFGQVEYRYSNYELDIDGHQMLVGLGFRF